MTSEPSFEKQTPDESPSDSSSQPAAPAALPVAQDQDDIHEGEVAELVERLDRVPPIQREAIFAYFHSGPLPPPHQLERYNEILPGGAERIFDMAKLEQGHRIGSERELQSHQIVSEKELQAHRIEVEKEQVADDRAASRRGQHYGALITLLAVAGAVWVAASGGHPAAVAAIVGLPVATIITVLITGRKREKSGEPPSPSDAPHP